MSRAPFVAVRTDIRKEERVAFIADHAGYNEYEALGRLTSLWCWCTDRGLEDAPDDCPGYAVPDAVVRRFLGPRGVEAILGDGCDELAMGQRRPDGLIYLRGTGDTVDRLRSLRTSSRAGGLAQAANGKRGAKGRFVAADTDDQPCTTSREPAASSEIPDPRSQIPDPVDQDLSPARARAPQAVQPGDPARARRQALRAELWRELGAARSAVGAELKVEHRPLGVQDPGERALAMLLVGAGEALDATAADVRHAIAIAAAEARRDRSLQWLTGVIFDERNFRRLAATTLEDARRPRPAKPGEPARMPPRRADPPPPVVVVSAADRADAAAVLAEARAKLLGARAEGA